MMLIMMIMMISCQARARFDIADFGLLHEWCTVPQGGAPQQGPFDVILCNPPYLPAQSKKQEKTTKINKRQLKPLHQRRQRWPLVFGNEAKSKKTQGKSNKLH